SYSRSMMQPGAAICVGAALVGMRPSTASRNQSRTTAKHRHPPPSPRLLEALVPPARGDIRRCSKDGLSWQSARVLSSARQREKEDLRPHEHLFAPPRINVSSRYRCLFAKTAKYSQEQVNHEGWVNEIRFFGVGLYCNGGYFYRRRVVARPRQPRQRRAEV